jgi:NinB protein
MSRALLVLANDAIRARALRWIAGAPVGTRVTFQEPKRTLPQNDMLWKLLTDIAAQKQHCGRKYPPDAWKAIFMHALGREMKFVPALDGQGFIPLGLSSSNLSKAEMSELLEMILAYGAENGVTWSEPGERSAA